MKVIKQLHLNDFEYCSIPTPRDLYLRFGFTAPQINGSSSDVDFTEPCNLVSSKLSSLELGQSLAVKEYLNSLDAAKQSANDVEQVKDESAF